MALEWRRYKATRPEFRAADGDNGPAIEGYAAVFNRYSQNLGGFVEQIDPGAFADALGRGVVGLFNHSEDFLLGSVESDTLALSVDDVGLRYRIELDMADPDAQRVESKVRRGLLRGSSFSFDLAPGGDVWSETDQGFALRTLRSVARVYDVGPVTFPAYKVTEEKGLAVALRSAPASVRGEFAEVAAETPPAAEVVDAEPVVRARRVVAGRWVR